MITSDRQRSVAAVGQPLLDIIVPCDEALLRQNRLRAGSHEFLTSQGIQDLLAQVSHDGFHHCTGGSALNSVKSARLLGLSGSYFGLTGSDDAGERVRALLGDEEIFAPVPAAETLPTGVCISLITRNGERTMRTDLGASARLDALHLQGLAPEKHAWVILEGYLLVSSEENRRALFAALTALEPCRRKAVFSLASDYVADSGRRVIFSSILPRTGLLVANEREACGLTETSSAEEALDALENHVPGVMITCGEKGSWTFFEGERFFTHAHVGTAEVVDTTGAGDVYLGAFLAGISMGHSPRRAASGATRMASLVISKHGAALPRNARDKWLEMMGGE
jgi:sugar/nucleoside kinase (ribokinase family)